MAKEEKEKQQKQLTCVEQTAPSESKTLVPLSDEEKAKKICELKKSTNKKR